MRKSIQYSLTILLLIILGTTVGCNYGLFNHQTVPPAQTPKVEEPAPSQNPAPVEPPSTSPTLPTGQSSSWWFTRNQNHQLPAVNQDTKALLASNNAFYVLPNDQDKIYLTFDEGYELGYTPTILDILDRHHVKAGFFITGQYIKTQPELVKRMHTAGHLVGNHTWNHPDLPTLSQSNFNQEINSLEQKYLEVTGTPMMPYLRPPMGNYSPATLQWANALGYKTVFWSMAFADWDPNKQPGAEFSYQHVIANIHPGAVILLHAVSKSNTEALDRIIMELKRQGYVFSTFDSN